MKNYFLLLKWMNGRLCSTICSRSNLINGSEFPSSQFKIQCLVFYSGILPIIFGFIRQLTTWQVDWYHFSLTKFCLLKLFLFNFLVLKKKNNLFLWFVFVIILPKLTIFQNGRFETIFIKCYKFYLARMLAILFG